MPSWNRFWDDARLSEAEAMLRSETSASGALQSVARKLSQKWGVSVTAGAIGRALREHRHTSACQLVGSTAIPSSPIVGSAAVPSIVSTDPPAPVDPVAEHIERRRENRSRTERKDLIERLALAEERVRVLEEIGAAMPPAKIRPRERDSGLREATAVALASDWHVEETVEPDKVDGKNKYDLVIAEARANRFFDGVEWLVNYHRQGFTVRDVVLWLGGDLMTGYIHEELVEENGLSPTETVLMLRRVLTMGIRRLLADKSLERLIIPCSYGNHGRTTEKRRVATGAQNSFEWLMYHVLASDFADEPRVRFQVAAGAHTYVEVYDLTLHFHHGDEINYGGGVGGISIPINKAVAQWNTVRKADYHCFGHFHQRLEGRDWNANGSLIGYSPYAFSVKAAFERPQQSFFLLDSKHGRCMSTPIWLDDSSNRSAA